MTAHGYAPAMRTLPIRSVAIWDGTPIDSVPQRWCEIGQAVRPTQVIATVEVGTADGVASGVAGVTRYHVDGEVAIAPDLAEHVAERWRGVDVLALQHQRESMRNPYEPEAEQLSVLIELAAIDAVGHLFDLPASLLFGSRAQHRIRAYASLPSFVSTDEAIDCAAQAVAAGFSAVKFHGSGYPEIDCDVIRAVRGHLGPERMLMWDGSCAYDLAGATEVARTLAQHGALWFEAPMSDESGPALRQLAARSPLPLVPDGLVNRSPGDVMLDVAAGVWGAIRFDVTRSSSLARSLRLLRLAESMGLPAEIQSYGFPLARYANLQLMLTSTACRFYESPFPDTLTDPLAEPPALHDGHIAAADAPGLGHGVSADDVRARCRLIAESLAGQT